MKIHWAIRPLLHVILAKARGWQQEVIGVGLTEFCAAVAFIAA